MAQYQKALEINPNITEAHNDLGVIFAQKGQMDDAIAQFQEAVRLNPGDSNAQTIWLKRRRWHGRFTVPNETFRQLRVDPKPSDSLQNTEEICNLREVSMMIKLIL